MKYLFINVVAGIGSTGRIAAEKCRELQAQGHECVLAYGRAESGCEGIRTHRIGTDRDIKLHGLDDPDTGPERVLLHKSDKRVCAVDTGI